MGYLIDLSGGPVNRLVFMTGQAVGNVAKAAVIAVVAKAGVPCSPQVLLLDTFIYSNFDLLQKSIST
jgi:hypothetical protein